MTGKALLKIVKGAKGAKTYIVRYERDETGWWVASIQKVEGCHTQGKTIDQARTRIREALALFVEGADKAILIDDIRLPAELRALLNRQKAAREKATKVQQYAQKATLAAVKKLRQAHVSIRDAGELLGLSHQRVQQLLH